MNQDQAKGGITEAGWEAKEITGKLIGVETLEFKGKLERAGGKGQGLYGGVKANLKIIQKGNLLRARSPFDRRHGMNMRIHDSDRIKTDSLGKGRLPMLFGARTFLGDEVYNYRDERLGTLKEFMLDLHSGRICYAVMSAGGFLGVGEKLFAIPWRALTVDAENACFALDIAEERLMNSPGFDKRHWGIGLTWAMPPGSRTSTRFTESCRKPVKRQVTRHKHDLSRVACIARQTQGP
jgi:uncharacterized protein YjbJ (UPF0337 family)